MGDYYILNDDHSVSEVDVTTWAKQFENRDSRRVGSDELPNGKYVSTVFLGIDHRFLSDGRPPLIFETMVFPSHGNFSEEYCERYSTWDEAVKGHRRAVVRARKMGKDND